MKKTALNSSVLLTQTTSV